MKKIITIMVLGLMVATAAMADGPKYGFASRPSGNASVGNMNVRVGVTPSTTINAYKPGTTGAGRSFGPATAPGSVSTGATVRTSRTIVTRRKTTSRPGALSTDYNRNPSASIVTSSAAHSSSASSYGGKSTALGLSTSASTNSGGYSGGGSYSGSGSSSVVYGRTSSSSSYASSTGSSSGSSTSGQSRIGAIPGGGNSETDGTLTGIRGALIGGNSSTPNVIINNESGETKDGPVGDAIIPMLLLISLITVYKWKFKK